MQTLFRFRLFFDKTFQSTIEFLWYCIDAAKDIELRNINILCLQACAPLRAEFEVSFEISFRYSLKFHFTRSLMMTDKNFCIKLTFSIRIHTARSLAKVPDFEPECIADRKWKLSAIKLLNLNYTKVLNWWLTAYRAWTRVPLNTIVYGSLIK